MEIEEETTVEWRIFLHAIETTFDYIAMQNEYLRWEVLLCDFSPSFFRLFTTLSSAFRLEHLRIDKRYATLRGGV